MLSDLCQSKEVPGLTLYLYRCVKRQVIFDVARFGAWIRVVPGGVLKILAFHFSVQIVRHALPWVTRLMITITEVLTVYGVWREIYVSFNDLVFLALREYNAVPNRFCHSVTPK